MFNKKAHGRYTHILIALAVMVGLWYLNTMYNWVVLPASNAFYIQLALITLIYAQMADVDQEGSKINQYVVLALVGVIIYSFYNPMYQSYGIIAAIIIGALEFINHRKILHSLVGGLILAAPLLYFGIIQFAAGMIAFLSHLISEGEFSIFSEKDWRLRR